MDGLIVSSDANISYLTGSPSRDSKLLISKNKNVYFTDSRYITAAKKALGSKFIIKKVKHSFAKIIAETCAELKLETVGFEDRALSVAEHRHLQKEFSHRHRLEPVPCSGLVESLREIKDAQEIENIRQSLAITALALKFAQEIILPGRKELEIVGELERFIRYHGAEKAAFEIIVASGPNSAYPHHLPTQRKIKENEPVMIDIGVDYLGYKSDLTRVFFLGKMDALARRIYNIVTEAQKRAIKKIKPGVEISQIDAAARDFIAQKGYAKYFGHALGHGVGLETHEAPNISPNNHGRLKPGMVFTVEPAIYLPGKFGIRIEDMVLVTRKGAEVLSGTINQ